MPRPLIGVLPLALLLPASSLACQQRTSTVADSQNCPGCKIVLERMVTLGTSGEPPLTRLTKVAVDSQGRFYAAPTMDRGRIVMFDGRGVATRTFGRPGQGPGEFDTFIHMLRVGPGDSLHVFEGSRETILYPGIAGFGSVRVLPLMPNDLAFRDDGRVVVHRTILGEGRAALPLHLLTAQGRIARSFGGTDRQVPLKPYLGLRVIAPASRNRIWSAHFAAYQIDLWGADGSHLRTLSPHASWFRPWENEALGTTEERRRPRVVDLAEDSNGRLWVSILVPDPGPRPPPRGEVRLDEVDQNAEFDTVLEVLDPRTGQVLAHGRFEQSMPEFIGKGNMLFSRREDADGNVVIDVWRVSLATLRNRGRR